MSPTMIVYYVWAFFVGAYSGYLAMKACGVITNGTPGTRLCISLVGSTIGWAIFVLPLSLMGAIQ